jgi:hypothetical protein
MEPAHFGERADKGGAVCEGHSVNSYFSNSRSKKTYSFTRDIHSCPGGMAHGSGSRAGVNVHRCRSSASTGSCGLVRIGSFGL